MGGRSSSSSSSSSSNITNNVDARRVIGEGATNLENSSLSFDNSNRSTNVTDARDQSTNLVDVSNRSSTLTDNRDQSTNVYNSFDAGAVEGGLNVALRGLQLGNSVVSANTGLARDVVTSNTELVDSFGKRLTGFATDALKSSLASMRDTQSEALAAAAQSQRASFGLVDSAIGSARSTLRDALDAVNRTNAQSTSAVTGAANLLQSAYADAKGTTASLNKIVIAALAVAGVAVVVFALKAR